MNHPDVILIYQQDDGDYCMFGAHYNDGNWRNSKLVDMPRVELDSFLAELRQMGRTIIDPRPIDSSLPITAMLPGFPLKTAADYVADMMIAIMKAAKEMP